MWELNPRPLQEQPVFFTSEPSLYPTFYPFSGVLGLEAEVPCTWGKNYTIELLPQTFLLCFKEKNFLCMCGCRHEHDIVCMQSSEDNTGHWFLPSTCLCQGLLLMVACVRLAGPRSSRILCLCLLSPHRSAWISDAIGGFMWALWVWSQVFRLARQLLYLLSHLSRPVMVFPLVSLWREDISVKPKVIEESQQQLGAASPPPPAVRKQRVMHECRCAVA